MSLPDLIDRLKRADGPDRELDCEIAITVLGGEIVWKTANYTMEPYPARKYASHDHVGGFGMAPVERYTESLDAALQLIPADHDWIVADVNGCVGGTPYACVGDLEERFGETAVLSLCIAALIAKLKATQRNTVEP